MRAFCVLLGLLAFLAGLITGEILELDDDNFEQTVKSSPLVLVDFYVPWCPHCTNLNPEFTQADSVLAKTQPTVRLAKTARLKAHPVMGTLWLCPHCTNLNPEFTQADSVLAKTQPTVRLAKVNCNAFNTKRICKDNNVRFLPWLVLFSQGKSFKLYGDLPRDAPTIIKFMNTAVQKPDLLDSLQDSTPQNKMQPKDTCDEASKDQGAAPDPASPAVLNLNDQNFNETIKKNEYVLVDFYAPWCSDCQRLSPLFDTAALQLRDNNPSLRFAKVVCDKGHADSFGVCGEAHLKFFPWVVLYHNSQQVKTYPFENWPDTCEFLWKLFQAEAGPEFVKKGVHLFKLNQI
ncbi:predicted protein [Nematostella vectensis]|uniref:Thioredoxin domain-containing protein n=1 Tax=Nematostella vectensis TaxID=45351 RepID=A7S9T1_NEMVE|nr:predicted protein [Nematostella vectensis]|eukprot:XP_001631630.1 predicted protein [Nematostella vectensis]